MSDVTLWWIALAAGAVVTLVAAGLLHLFYREVRRIERNAEAIWLAGKQVASNTATTWQLDEVSKRLDTLAEEAQRHDALLSNWDGAQ